MKKNIEVIMNYDAKMKDHTKPLLMRMYKGTNSILEDKTQWDAIILWI